MIGLKLQKRLKGEFGQRLVEGRGEASDALLERIGRNDVSRLVAALTKSQIEEFEVVVQL
ncbi:hypothetical protein QIH85_42940 [Bradyrhizobium japonicum]|uniref:hypothetical protein n=1 Tax=Bradyrhizobium japonicum TaxID=375 RepID=UPI001E4EE0C8|nr:hypothetical protein [Bradyrhizobium japonicum]MCD9898120.1 hypothetical protein [Bradyrhizobium japonicum]WLB28489.1 hypothetical protein QIH85_42940 [Bradyrhizobium japonicum]WRJ84757.1 hypothetical protein R3F78_07715 [Bradyrhizobium japonicum]WRJ93727.1 hypothetical protein R3F77_05425 [Bradyrhizobium japonicum]WRK47579.1 hypothetical protein R3F73_05485 [Bradyrhizobium japonicum]